MFKKLKKPIMLASTSSLSILVICIFILVTPGNKTNHHNPLIINKEVNTNEQLRALAQTLSESDLLLEFNSQDFYDEKYLNQIRTNSETLVDQALMAFSKIKKPSQEVILEYSKLQPCLNYGIKFQEEKQYSFALENYLTAENYAHRVIKYYEIETGIIQGEYIYKEVSDKLVSYKRNYQELHNDDIFKSNTVDCDNLSNLLAIETLTFQSLASLESQIKSIEVEKDNQAVIHTFSAMLTGYQDQLYMLEQLVQQVKNHQVDPGSRKVQILSNNELNKEVELIRKEFLQEKQNKDNSNGLQELVRGECAWLSYLVSKTSEEGFLIYSNYLLMQLQTRANMLKELSTSKEGNHNAILRLIIHERNEVKKKLEEISKNNNYDVKWLMSRFFRMNANFNSLCNNITVTSETQSGIQEEQLNNILDNLYTIITEISGFNLFLNHYFN